MRKAKCSAIHILDIALNELKYQGPFDDGIPEKLVNTGVDKKIIARAWKHLEKDGLVYSNHTKNSETSSTIRYYMSFEGLLAIENCPIFYKSRPYKWKSAKATLGLIWRLCSIIAIIINALIIIIFTYLTFIKQN